MIATKSNTGARSRALDWPDGWERRRVSPGVYLAEGYRIERVKRGQWLVTQLADRRLVRRDARLDSGAPYLTLADAIQGVAHDMAKRG